MTNTIAKTDNTGKGKRQMKDQKRKDERQRPKQKIGREYLYSRV